MYVQIVIRDTFSHFDTNNHQFLFIMRRGGAFGYDDYLIRYDTLDEFICLAGFDLSEFIVIGIDFLI